MTIETILIGSAEVLILGTFLGVFIYLFRRRK